MGKEEPTLSKVPETCLASFPLLSLFLNKCGHPWLAKTLMEKLKRLQGSVFEPESGNHAWWREGLGEEGRGGEHVCHVGVCVCVWWVKWRDAQS